MYTNLELADMHFTYGTAHGNASQAKNLYQEKFPNRRVPDRRMFIEVHRRPVETSSFEQGRRSGHPITVRTPELEEVVLEAVENNPELSTRKISRDLQVSCSTIWNILKDQLLYPYHIQRVQVLLPNDFPQRLELCRWMQQMLNQNPYFLSEILFTDECNFSRDAIMNFHNNHVYADENPHAIIESRHQYQFSINVWVGIVGDYLIGPAFLPPRLNGNAYREFLENQLPELLEDVPVATRQRMFFMHDGAPAHFSRVARDWLNTNYFNRWIGRNGPYPWPPRSPDINPLDFFLWGHLKSLIYKTPVESEADLRQRIMNGCQEVAHMPGVFERVRQSLRRRLEACIAVEGGHFQQFL